MVDLSKKLEKVLKPFNSSIQQKHQAGDKFVAVVFDDATKTDLLAALAPFNLKLFITVAAPVVYKDKIEASTTDTVGIVYMGTLEIRHMQLTSFGKKANHQFAPRFLEIFKAAALPDSISEAKRLAVFEPVILSKDFTVIDGEQRIAIALELDLARLPAIVLNTTPLQAKFLRLVLNKSNEFQRWHWDAVDTFLEQHPELLPQLEPLAIFGERVVPESYFGNTVIGYEIHSDEGVKSQQSFYKQEHGLARWAKKKREELEKVAENSKTAKRAASKNLTPSMFDITEEDK